MPSRALLALKNEIAIAKLKPAAETGPGFDIKWVDRGFVGGLNDGSKNNPFNNATTALTDAHAAASTTNTTFIFVANSSVGAPFTVAYLESVTVTKPVIFVAVGEVWWGPTNSGLASTPAQRIAFKTSGQISITGTIGFTFFGGLAGAQYALGWSFSHYIGEVTTGGGSQFSPIDRLVIAENKLAFITCEFAGTSAATFLANLTGAGTKSWLIEENFMLIGSVSVPDANDVPSLSPVNKLNTNSFAGGWRFGGQSLTSFRGNSMQFFNSGNFTFPVRFTVDNVVSSTVFEVDEATVTTGNINQLTTPHFLQAIDGSIAFEEFEIVSRTGPVGGIHTFTVLGDLTGLSNGDEIVAGLRMSGSITNEVHIYSGAVMLTENFYGYINPADITGNTFVIEWVGWNDEELSLMRILPPIFGAISGTKKHALKANIYSLGGVGFSGTKELSYASKGFESCEDPDIHVSETASDNSKVDNSSIRLITTKSSYNGVVVIDTVNGSSGTDTLTLIGTEGNPVDNIVDAAVIAAEVGSRTYKIRGSITLDTGYDDWEFISSVDAVLDLNNQSVDGSAFTGIDLTGQCNGTINVIGGVIRGVTNFAGTAAGAAITGTITFAAGSHDWYDCYSIVPGTSSPTLNMSGGSRSFNLRRYAGGVAIQNFTDINESMTLEGLPGNITLEASCTAGTIVLRGHGNYTDNSAGSTVDVDGFTVGGRLDANISSLPTSADIADDVWDEASADHVSTGSFGQLTGKKLLKTGTFIGLK